jgi:hypothetical protein
LKRCCTGCRHRSSAPVTTSPAFRKRKAAFFLACRLPRDAHRGTAQPPVNSRMFCGFRHFLHTANFHSTTVLPASNDRSAHVLGSVAVYSHLLCSGLHNFRCIALWMSCTLLKTKEINLQSKLLTKIRTGVSSQSFFDIQMFSRLVLIPGLKSDHGGSGIRRSRER